MLLEGAARVDLAYRGLLHSMSTQDADASGIVAAITDASSCGRYDGHRAVTNALGGARIQDIATRWVYCRDARCHSVDRGR